MTKTTWLNLVEKYGSEEAAREEMRRRAALSSRNKKGTGGFAHMAKTDPDRLKQLGKQYGRKKQDVSDSV